MATNVPTVSFADAHRANGTDSDGVSGTAQPAAPALSLILCTYQRTSELEVLFRSLAAQTFRAFEVIVVDQNPDSRISPYLRMAEHAGLAVRHIRHGQPNLSVARNIGIQAARGEWVGFPDDDCWYEPDTLEKLSGCFFRADALSGCAARWDELSEPAGLPLNLSWDRSRRFRDRMLASFVLFFNRRLFDHVGNFDHQLGVGQWFGAGEETDLILRALRAGAALTLYPAARVHHPVKELTNPVEVRRRARGAGALYAKHHLPLWVIIRGLVAPVVCSFFGGASPKQMHIGWMYVRGRWEGMRRWKQVGSGYSLHSYDPAQRAPRQQLRPVPTEMRPDG